MAANQQECSICMDCFKNPKLISCHHSFCYKCLEDYVQVNLQNGRFNCPICRTSVNLPASGVSGFKSNFYINTDSSEKFPCDICGPKNVASSRCLDCEENLCQSCCYVHEKSKGTRHHKIGDLGTLDSETKGKIRQRVFCDEHPEEEIKLVCQDCKVPICFMCKVIKHDTHPTKSVADVAAEVKKTLDTKLNQCQDRLRRIKASTTKGEELDRSINDAECQELKKVDDQCSELHKAIDQEAAKFKEKIKNVYHLLREQNAVFRRYIQEEFSLCSNTRDNAQKLKDQGTDIEIVRKGPDIEQLISAAIVKTDPTPTIRLDNKLFSPAKIIASNLIPLIGIIQDSTDAEEREKKEREEREKKEREGKKKKKNSRTGQVSRFNDLVSTSSSPLSVERWNRGGRGEGLLEKPTTSSLPSYGPFGKPASAFNQLSSKNNEQQSLYGQQSNFVQGSVGQSTYGPTSVQASNTSYTYPGPTAVRASDFLEQGSSIDGSSLSLQWPNTGLLESGSTGFVSAFGSQQTQNSDESGGSLFGKPITMPYNSQFLSQRQASSNTAGFGIQGTHGGDQKSSMYTPVDQLQRMNMKNY